jgi:transcriptional regulator with XRE-family HTH domain
MDSTFGARLRQQREAREVTLATISAKTKIKFSLLEQLENDDLSAWPKGLFGRAYLRDYATAIGLDPEALVSDFLAINPEFAYVTPQAEEAEAAAARAEARNGAAQKFRRLVSSAFSVRPARSAADATPSPRFTKPLDFDELPEIEPVMTEDAGPELIGTSIPHMLAEAQEREAIPFAELEAREEILDMPPMPRVAPEPLAPANREISLSAIADVCTRLARAIDFREVTTLLGDAARLLDAVGVIVWQWDPRATALRPSLACGYSDTIVARLPEVRTDDANAVATAFRSGEQCIIDGHEGTEAIVVPSLGVGGCVGVLAVELRPGTRERESLCAFTNILAAQLATLLPAPEPVEA